MVRRLLVFSITIELKLNKKVKIVKKMQKSSIKLEKRIFDLILRQFASSSGQTCSFVECIQLNKNENEKYRMMKNSGPAHNAPKPVKSSYNTFYRQAQI